MEVDEVVAPSKLGLVRLGVQIQLQRSQYGVRHNDYIRYRKYCSRRLRTLYTKLKFLHGKGKFVQKKLEAGSCREPRHLHIPLTQAERAWAIAMQLKQQQDNQGYIEPQERLKMTRRAKKAAIHATELARLSALVGAAQTGLEGEAYCMLVHGFSLLILGEDFRKALAKFTRSKVILEDLCRAVLDPESLAAYRAMLEEVEPQIRFCAYQLGRQQGAAAPPAIAEAILVAEAATDASADLAALRSRLAAEQTAAPAAAPAAAAVAPTAAPRLAQFAWRGQAYAAACDPARGPLHDAAAVSLPALSATDPLGLAAAPAQVDALGKATDKFTLHLAHAITAVRTPEMQAGAGLGPEAQARVDELRALRLALQGAAADAQIAKGIAAAIGGTAALLQGACRPGGSVQWAQPQGVAGRSGARAPRAEEIVRVCEGLVGHATTLGDIGLEMKGRQGEALMEESAARVAEFQALRCLVLALSHLQAGRAGEAFALAGRCADLCRDAAGRHADLSGAPVPGAKELLGWIGAQGGLLAAIAKADAAAAAHADREGLQRAAAALSMGERAAGPEEGFLRDNLSEWVSFAGSLTAPSAPGYVPPRVSPLLPEIRAVASRPILLDTVLSAVHYPAVDHRTKAGKGAGAAQQASTGTGVFNRLMSFGWGGAK